MSSFGYDSDDLRTAGRHASDAAHSASAAHAALGDAPGASPFGSVPAGAALHGAVTQAHRTHALGARRAHAGFADRAARARATGTLGDDNTAATLATARGSS